jgi:hypothetical protein
VLRAKRPRRQCESDHTDRQSQPTRSLGGQSIQQHSILKGRYESVYLSRLAR